MFEQLREVAARYDELNSQLADPEIVSDHHRYMEINKEIVSLREVVETWRALEQCQEQIQEAQELLEDPEMKDLAWTEIEEANERIPALEDQLKILMLPTDPRDDKNIILEIRAGTGGDESALFAGDLFEMYSRYAATRGWTVEVISTSEGTVGGFKEIIAMISGDKVYSFLKWESGTHRVQRVPVTETQGRVHTSAATVAILAEADDVEIEIDPSDLRIDTFRASGAGGQHVNKTDSAIRITHIPTGLVVSSQDERSQHKNRARAMKILRARLFDEEQQRLQNERADNRRAQVGSGDRSERIRTYNFPQNRLTDHRIGLTLYSLDAVMQGSLQEVIDALNTYHQAELLKQVEER